MITYITVIYLVITTLIHYEALPEWEITIRSFIIFFLIITKKGNSDAY